MTTRTLPVLLQGGAYGRQSLDLTADLDQNPDFIWPPEALHFDGYGARWTYRRVHGERTSDGSYVFRMHHRERLDMIRLDFDRPFS